MHIQCPHCRGPIEIVETPARAVVCPSCGSSIQLEPGATNAWLPTEAPRRLGKFEFLEQLGVGAFGTVYKARDTELDRIVALKVPRGGSLGPADRERFLREAKSAAQLKHPGIVALYDTGQVDGTCYIVSEFVQGATLADRLTAGRLPFRQAAEILADVAVALHFAHQHGVIHRDLKPSNILLSVDGGQWSAANSREQPTTNDPQRTIPKITDFGLAKRAADEVTMTVDGQILGTPAYLSPEAARGEVRTIDAKSDVYSLGVIFYELLTGELPFRGNTRMLLAQVMQDEPRPPRRLDDRIPRDLETICLKAMAKTPGRRYATAQALSEDLRRCLNGEPIQARPVAQAERAWRWCQRNRPLAGALAAAVVFLVLGTIVSTVLAFQSRAEARRADIAADTSQKEKALSDRRFYAADMKLASLEAEAGQMNLVQQRLQGHVPKQPGYPDLRGFEWYHLDRLCHMDLRTLSGHANIVEAVAFSPDGRRIASASHDQSVKVWDATSGQEILTLKGHLDVVHSVAFSPDGRRIASGSRDQTVKVWDIEAMASGGSNSPGTVTLKGHTGWVHRVVFSSDGRRIASASYDRTVKVWDAASGQEILTLKGHTRGVSGVAFSPDGRRIASASWDGSVWIWDAHSGQDILALKRHTDLVVDVAFSPDGRQIASASRDRTVRVWDAASGQETLVFKGHTDLVVGVAFSPVGRRIASASRDRTVKIWDAGSGQEFLALKGHTGTVQGVAFSPDGRRIASASYDQTVKVWDAGSGQEFLGLKGHTSQVDGVAFSPDGRRIASASRDETVKVWDAGTGHELFALKGHTGIVRCVVFSANGRRIASASYDRTVKVWDAGAGQELLTLKHAHPVWSVAFSPDGRRIASASGDQTVKIWDAGSGHEKLALNGHTQDVLGVVFSPDGRRIASASGDQTVKVWDADSGREILTLKGHADGVSGVAFSPDGRRIASASLDHTVKIWDAGTGQEILTLKGHTDSVWCVAFSPDGRRIASASGDQTVKIWDAADLTQELLAEREARGLLHFRCRTIPTKDELLDAIRRDATISAAVRRVAVERAGPFWESLVEYEAQKLVRALFDELLIRGDVLEKIQTSSMSSGPVRRRAIALAEQWPRDPQSLNLASWAIVSNKDQKAEVYRRALRFAEEACRLAPEVGNLVNTLGVAQYRVDKYQESVATLARSAKLNAKKDGTAHPSDLAFMAMAHFRLGEKGEAKIMLQRLREVMKDHVRSQDLQFQSFLREAEELIEGNKGPRTK